MLGGTDYHNGRTNVCSRTRRTAPLKQDVMSEEMNNLIPELADWNNGDGIDVDAWLQCMGSFSLAIAFGELFWPKFEVED